jgi:hypothetical protein
VDLNVDATGTSDLGGSIGATAVGALDVDVLGITGLVGTRTGVAAGVERGVAMGVAGTDSTFAVVLPPYQVLLVGAGVEATSFPLAFSTIIQLELRLVGGLGGALSVVETTSLLSLLGTAVGDDPPDTTSTLPVVGGIVLVCVIG